MRAFITPNLQSLLTFNIISNKSDLFKLFRKHVSYNYQMRRRMASKLFSQTTHCAQAQRQQQRRLFASRSMNAITSGQNDVNIFRNFTTNSVNTKTVKNILFYVANNNNNNNTSQKRTTSSSSSSSYSASASSASGTIEQIQFSQNDKTSIGSVHLILGPMFAGKTTALLKRVQELERAGANVLLIKSDKDTRYAKDKVVTHDGVSRECFPVKSLDVEVVKEAVGVERWEEADCVAIDEAQFLTNLYEFCRVVADEDDKIVLVAGLNGDFKREPFGEVQETLPLCDSVTKLTAKCKCGRAALFSKRVVSVQGQELVGGADKYLPACRRCYLI